MKHTTSLSLGFEASHTYGVGRCKGLHGHSWTLTLVFESEPEDEEGRGHAADLLAALIREIDHRHLNDQLPASSPSPQGVSAWAFERCDMVVPGLVRVVVEMDVEETAICER